MSSGWNGIGIRSVGRTRRKLAEMLSQATGWVVEARNIGRTNPINQHFEDCCAWDVWADVPAKQLRGIWIPTQKGHIYSWDRMGDIVKHGVLIVSDRQKDPLDIEVMAAEERPK